jgi:hypothetical protein
LWRISLKKGLKFVNGSPSRKDKYKYWPTKWRCHDINWPDLNCTNSREGNKISYCRAFIYIYCEVTGACCHETVKPRRAKIRIIKVEKSVGKEDVKASSLTSSVLT